MKTKYIILIIIAVAVIAFLVYYFMKMRKDEKDADAKRQGELISQIGNAEAVASGNCIPFTAEEQKANRNAIMKGCLPQLVIPFIGVKKYNDCVQEGLKNLPPIKTCY